MDVKKISRRSWRVLLQQTATRLNRSGNSLRVAILGVGNELNGDDAAGVLALKALQQKGLASGQFLLLDTGSAPENFTSPLVKFSPNWIIVMDAARMGYRPGQIAFLGIEEIEGASAFTHGLPLSMIGEYLVRMTHCSFSFLGIQVAQTGFGLDPEPVVSRAAFRLAQGIGQVLKRMPLYS